MQGITESTTVNTAIADMLTSMGFNIMASHARHEQNKEVLRGYANLVRIEAERKENWEVLDDINRVRIGK